MKFRIKLLKSWTAPDGTDYKQGDIVELEDKALAGELLADGIGEKAAAAKEGADHAELKSTIAAAVKDELTKAIKPLEEKVSHITTHEKADDDMTGGYLPATAGREHTKEEKFWGLGNFCLDVYNAAKSGMGIPERLKNSVEKSRKVLESAVKGGYVDKAAVSGYEHDTGGRGGFLIPPEFNTMLLDQGLETATIRPRATSLSLNSSQVDLPQYKNYDHSSDTLFGGLSATWESENAAIDTSRGEVEQVQLNLHGLTVMAYASHKMLQFSPITVGSFLLPQMAETITWKEEDGFINGTGAGQPLGLKNADCALNIAIETGQTLAASAFVTENAIKMYQGAMIKKAASAVWLYNKVDLFYWLSLCTIDVGTGGAPAGLIQRLPGSPEMNMLGIPLVDTEHCEAAGTVGDIYLADVSQYLIADDRRGPEIATSQHIQFDTGQEAFRIIKYVDGQPRWKKAFTRQNSTNQTSPIMRMATRS